MFRRLLLRALLVTGILANIAFLLINLWPERPHLATRRRVKVMVRANAQQAKWIKENELDEFGAQHDLEFDMVTTRSFDELYERLRREKDDPTGILLAGIDEAYSDNAVADKLVVPVEGVLSTKATAYILKSFMPETVQRGTFEGKMYYVPKRGSMDVMGFIKPAVEDAYLHWDVDREGIDAALREANGVGLPHNYSLQRSPNHWNDFDVFVAAWYWAHHPAPWAGTRAQMGELISPSPRVAHRTGTSAEAVNDLVGAFYRHGLHDRDVGKVDAQAVVDALQWEALLYKHGLLAKECEAQVGCDADSVAALIASRRVAYAPLNQEDSLWVHGGARKDSSWAMENAGDLGWALKPSGASLELLNGRPARKARSFSFLEVTFWAVPIRSPDRELATRLAAFLTQRGLQQREAEALGMLPIRVDLRDQYPIFFRLDWMQALLDASYRQAQIGAGEVPQDIVDKGYGGLYARLREQVVMARGRA
jgi:ABC-type glycerol-3-phosphate transport system substrate-binding protein